MGRFRQPTILRGHRWNHLAFRPERHISHRPIFPSTLRSAVTECPIFLPATYHIFAPPHSSGFDEAPLEIVPVLQSRAVVSSTLFRNLSAPPHSRASAGLLPRIAQLRLRHRPDAPIPVPAAHELPQG